MIISTDTQKAFDKIQRPLVTKTLIKVGIEGKYLNIIKTICDKSTANLILDDEKLKAFPLKSGTKGFQDSRGVGGCGVPLSPWMHQEYIYRCNNTHRTPAIH